MRHERPVRPGLRPERPDLRPERLDLRPERTDLRPEKLDLRPESLDLRPERPDFRPERPDLRSQRPELKPEALDVGGTNGRTDGRTNESPPVFYRTSSPSEPLPKKGKKKRGIMTFSFRRLAGFMVFVCDSL